MTCAYVWLCFCEAGFLWHQLHQSSFIKEIVDEIQCKRCLDVKLDVISGDESWLRSDAPVLPRGTPAHRYTAHSLPAHRCIGTPVHRSLPPVHSTSYQAHLAASLLIQTLLFNLTALEALNRYHQHWFSFWFWSGGGKSYSLPLLPSTLHNLNHICNRYIPK